MKLAYWIAHITVTIPERYHEYKRAAPDVIQQFGGRFLARAGTSETVEGTAYDRDVIIEFPSLADALACYHSQEYAAVRALRDGACIAHVSIVEGV